jgi:hypothetical protein
MENINKVFKLPKDRESYMQSIIFIVAASLIILFAIINGWNGTVLDKLAVFLFGVVPIIVMYDKVHQFISINSIEISQDELLTKKNTSIVASSKIDNLAIKISIGIDGAIERSFYNLFNNKKLFTYKEKDMGRDESNLFLEQLSSFAHCNLDLLSESTYGQVMPISSNSVSQKAAEMNAEYVYKKVALKQWSWILIPVVVLLMIFTLIVIK